MITMQFFFSNNNVFSTIGENSVCILCSTFYYSEKSIDKDDGQGCQASAPTVFASVLGTVKAVIIV